ncbi:hypothetical protein OIO90_005477 [Microbotryomycetes sp. JL221]|nr:hypothetical protein OIO90_005477 [Microbotryomycetes sp. JL221]
MSPTRQGDPRSKSWPINKILVLSAVVVWVLLMAWSSDMRHKIAPPAVGTYQHFKRNLACRDGYSDDGYIVRGDGPTDISWIPYNETLTLADKLVNSADIPVDVLQHAMPDYYQYLERAVNESYVPEIEFARNRFILVVGDRQVATGPMIIAICMDFVCMRKSMDPSSLNLTLVHWHLYGMAESGDDWFLGNVSRDPRPVNFEDRITTLFAPLLARIGRNPDLILLNSSFWDMAFIAAKARYRKWVVELRASPRTLTWTELAWHRARLVHLVRVMQDRFDNPPMMFRTAHLRRDSDKSSNVEVFQINESIKALMRHLDVPLFPWAEFIRGEWSYTDHQHMAFISQPTYLFGNMMFYYLQKAVTATKQACSI